MVEQNCSLCVGMQMQTTRKSGKRLIKEKAFHIIYEAELELISDRKLCKDICVPADDTSVQEQQKEDYRKVFKKCKKVMMVVQKN